MSAPRFAFNDRVRDSRWRFGIVSEVEGGRCLVRFVRPPQGGPPSAWLSVHELQAVPGCAQPGRSVRHLACPSEPCTVVRVFSHYRVQIEFRAGRRIWSHPGHLRPASFVSKTFTVEPHP